MEDPVFSKEFPGHHSGAGSYLAVRKGNLGFAHLQIYLLFDSFVQAELIVLY